MDNKEFQIFSKKVKAGKRIYYFDVKSNKKMNDFYIIITEKQQIDVNTFKKDKIFLFKEDIDNFVNALNESVSNLKNQLSGLSKGFVPQEYPAQTEELTEIKSEK